MVYLDVSTRVARLPALCCPQVLCRAYPGACRCVVYVRRGAHPRRCRSATSRGCRFCASHVLRSIPLCVPCAPRCVSAVAQCRGSPTVAHEHLHHSPCDTHSMAITRTCNAVLCARQSETGVPLRTTCWPTDCLLGQRGCHTLSMWLTMPSLSVRAPQPARKRPSWSTTVKAEATTAQARRMS